MRKLLTKIFFPLFILLLGGYGQAYANTQEDCICVSHTNTIQTPAKFNPCKVQNTPATNQKYTQSEVEELNDRLDTTDSENEDDDTSSKKLLQAHKYGAIVFSLQLPEYSDIQTKKGFNNFKHFFHFTSYRRYIIFRVIRI